MGSASVLLASSGMLPDDCAHNAKVTSFCGRQYELFRRLAGNMPAKASRMLALPNRAALFTRSRNGNNEFSVFLSDKVLGAAT